MSQAAPTPTQPAAPRGLLTRFLDGVERVGNKLPDPAVLFLGLMLLVWVLSALLAARSHTLLPVPVMLYWRKMLPTSLLTLA